MCVSTKAPSVPAPPAPINAPAEAIKTDEAVKRARNQAQTKARNMGGSSSTMLTGARGLMAPASTAVSTLLGG